MTEDGRHDYIELENTGDSWKAKRPERKFPYLNLALFITTLVTTTVAGASFSAHNSPDNTRTLLDGLPFSISLISILLCHELGHYIASRKHDVDATLPYFIPAPSFIGTFGAIIKMKSAVPTRNALVDIGAAGPLAGFVVSLPFLVYGVSHSVIVESSTASIMLGDSLLMKFVTWVFWGSLADGKDVVLHPVAFAAWIGGFVTAMNLLPVSQLDGGHIAYALFGGKYRLIARLCILALLLLGFGGWNGWLIWAVILLLLRTKHPPVLYEHEQLTPFRKLIGYVSIFIFIITFIPIPFKIL